MSATLQKVKAIQDKNGDWFVIPEQLLPFYYIDCEDDALIDTGQFDNKWGKYLTGGDLNLVQLWAEI